MKKFGFTLAEVLITLGIIGVVAVLTIVPLVRNYQEKALINRLKETYSMLSRAYQMAVVTYGDPEGWDLGGIDPPASCVKASNYFKPFLKISKDCGTVGSKGCFYTGGYKALFNNTYATSQDPGKLTWFSKIMLNNGASLAFWTTGTCSSTGCITIMVDLNGPKPPNRAGVDYFYFYVSPTHGIKPSEPSVKKNCSSWCCEYRNTSNTNGTKCTKWIIEKGNMDYLRRDISNE